jgi:hypothetical protein
MTPRERKLALKLATLHPADRKWLLKRLPDSPRRRLINMLGAVPGWTDGRRAWLANVLADADAAGSPDVQMAPDSSEFDRYLARLGPDWAALAVDARAGRTSRIPVGLREALLAATAGDAGSSPDGFAATLDRVIATEEEA